MGFTPYAYLGVDWEDVDKDCDEWRRIVERYVRDKLFAKRRDKRKKNLKEKTDESKDDGDSKNTGFEKPTTEDIMSYIVSKDLTFKGYKTEFVDDSDQLVLVLGYVSDSGQIEFAHDEIVDFLYAAGHDKLGMFLGGC